MKKFFPYDLTNPKGVIGESHKIIGGQVRLLHIPIENSISIPNFVEASSAAALQLNEFFCHYSKDTQYREANRILFFNRALNGQTVFISYLACGSPVTADDMNEIGDRLDALESNFKDIDAAQIATNNNLANLTSETRTNLATHNNDINAHSSIRQKINSFYDENLHAHAQIRGEINLAKQSAINTAQEMVAEHNTNLTAHSDIRHAVDNALDAQQNLRNELEQNLRDHNDDPNAHDFIRGLITTEETVRKLDVDEIWDAIDGLSSAGGISAIDLDDYVTFDELQTRLDDLNIPAPVDTSNFVTKSELEERLDDFDIPEAADMSNFVTKSELQTQLDNLDIPAPVDTSNFLTNTDAETINAKISDVESKIPTDTVSMSHGGFSIAVNDWQTINDPDYFYCANISVSGLTSDSYAEINFNRESLDVVANAELCPSGETVADFIKLFTKKIPTSSIAGEYVIFKGGD